MRVPEIVDPDFFNTCLGGKPFIVLLYAAIPQSFVKSAYQAILGKTIYAPASGFVLSQNVDQGLWQLERAN